MIKENTLKQIEKISWFTLLRRRGSPLLFQYPIHLGAYRRFEDVYGLDIKFSNYAYVSIDGAVMVDAKELGKATATIAEEINKGNWSTFTRPVYEKYKSLLVFSKRISKIKFSKLTNSDLLNWLEKYIKEVEIASPGLPGTPMASIVIERKISEQLEPLLKDKRLKIPLRECLEKLIYPKKLSPIEEATREITELAAEIQKHSDLLSLFKKDAEEILRELTTEHSSFLSKIERYIKRYAYINMDLWLGQPLSLRDVVEELKTIVEIKNAVLTLKHMRSQESRAKKEAEKIIKSLGIRGEFIKLVGFARELYTLRQYMRYPLLKAGYDAINLLTEIGKRVGFTYEQVLHLSPQEISKALSGEILGQREIKKRINEGYALYLIDGKFMILSGKDLKMRVFEAEVEERQTQVLGTVANIGKHKGRVKIVYTRKDIAKVKKSDVLVSTMTDPYFVPAMMKAGAIVTDEGGILSHAAIVSREFGIPCIVGTKIATKVLKDGDLVEVDAVKGIVKKLSAN